MQNIQPQPLRADNSTTLEKDMQSRCTPYTTCATSLRPFFPFLYSDRIVGNRRSA